MHLSFSTGTFYHRSLGYSLDLARAVGFDGVELVLGIGYLARGLAPYERAIARAGVPVLSVHPPLRPLPGWPRPMIERIPRTAAVARQLSAAVCVVHTEVYSDPGGPRAARYARALRLARDQAGSTTAIAIETNQYFGRWRRFVLDDLRTLVDFAQDHDCGVTLDTCHAGANGEDLLECHEIARPVLRNVHLSDLRWQDGAPQTHVLPGEGTLPLAPFLGALTRDGYDGLVTIELHPRQVGLFNRRRIAGRLRTALDFVRAATERAAPRADPSADAAPRVM